jgi:hypothetical protein
MPTTSARAAGAATDRARTISMRRCTSPASLRCGKGLSGSSTPRNSHSGPHAGHQHRRLADAALYAGVEILGVIAGKVHRGLPRSHLGAHLDDEIRRHAVVEAQVAQLCQEALYL